MSPEKSSKLSVSSASGSATGNPRNKTALKPGFSLVGWIRLANSEDLTGLKGKTIVVSHQELAKHNKPTDCWMAIRGKVYNVTRYLDYHPGGVDQLMRGAGKDATALFDEHHAWVNIDQLLAKCYMGPLKNTVTLNLNSSSTLDLRSKLSPPSTSMIKLPSILSLSSEALSKVFSDKQETPAPSQLVEVIPRFDWIQKTSDLSLYYYTKSFCNPGILINRTSDKECEVRIFIDGTSNAYKFSFLKPTRWPCTLRINQETGKIEINFVKLAPELWSNFGIYERTRTKDVSIYSDCNIVSKSFFNNDSFELILRPKEEQLMLVPIGFHLNFRLLVAGQDVIRSYTPIPLKLRAKEAAVAPSDILFLVKLYQNGTLSKHLSDSPMNSIMPVSQPKGSLDLVRVKSHTKFAMLAAGSGITPMISVIEHLLERSSTKIDTISLIYFNKTEADVWLRSYFDNLQQKEGRFNVQYVLSEPSASWTGDKGRISKSIVERVVKSPVTFAFVCGPLAFNDISVHLLEEAKVDLHCFQG